MCCKYCCCLAWATVATAIAANIVHTPVADLCVVALPAAAVDAEVCLDSPASAAADAATFVAASAVGVDATAAA